METNENTNRTNKKDGRKPKKGDGAQGKKGSNINV